MYLVSHPVIWAIVIEEVDTREWCTLASDSTPTIEQLQCGLELGTLYPPAYAGRRNQQSTFLPKKESWPVKEALMPPGFTPDAAGEAAIRPPCDTSVTHR